MSTGSRRIAIIGGGPIGLEAAVYASGAGWDVHVFERGRIAENIRQWGHVLLFSPFGMNTSGWGREALSGSADADPVPDSAALLSGREFVDRYLLPLSRLPQLSGRIHTGCTVRAVSRTRTWKTDFVGSADRGHDPFQLLLSDANGERTVEADYVFDCSGTYPHHNWMGAGGIPCVGEQAVLADGDYRLPEIAGADRARFAGKRTLVVGSGFSAATAVIGLARLSNTQPQTKVVWVTRTNRRPPLERFLDDPLAERDAVAETANRLALAASGPVNWLPGRVIRRFGRTADGEKLRVTIESFGGVDTYSTAVGSLQRSGRSSRSRSTESPAPGGHVQELVVDRIIANVGYRPDRSLYEELHVHECYASQGPMKLAAALLRETSGDCLSQTGQGPETLVNPEPDLFILGAKSYGRDSRFLLKAGIEQIRDVFSLIAGKAAS